MRERTICHCRLCLTERTLHAELLDSVNQDRQRIVLRSSPLLAAFNSGAALLSWLQSSKANDARDAILSELVTANTLFPDGVVAQTVLVLLFLPVLHATVRRVCRRYPILSREDTAQQALGAMLDYFHSPKLRARHTYVAFAIARQVRRSTFEWAAKEARSSFELAQSDHRGDEPLFEAAGNSFERAALLHHFLGRALLEGTLRSAELDLLIQFKLEGGVDNGAFSNAERQRLKRLVAKLRTRANGYGHRGTRH